MKNIPKLLIAILLITISPSIIASNNVNVSLSTSCIGQDSFNVKLWYTQDCIADSIPTTLFLTVKSTCGDTISVQLSRYSAYTGPASPMPCDPLRTCVGGWIPTQYPYYFEGQFALPNPCPEWKVIYERNQRDPLVNAIGNSLYIETTIYDPCTYSPSANSLYSIGIINNPATFNLGIASMVDSLVFSLSSPKTSEQSNILFNFGFTETQPIPGLTLNPNTGVISFTPTYLGEYVVGITIEAYSNYTGKLSSITLIDYTFWVIDTLNAEPRLSSIENLQGNAYLSNSTTINTPLGDSFSFEITATDAEANDSVSLWSDIKSILPGATVTTINGNPAKLLVSWKASINTNDTKKIKVSAIDNFCLPNMKTNEYTIIIGSGINSTHQIIKNLDVRFYPNPASEQLQIDIGENAKIEIEILDFLGKVKCNTQVLYSNTTTDISHLSSGVYLLRIKTKEGTQIQKFIKH